MDASAAEGTFADRRPRLSVVADIVPAEQSTNGFAARLHHFLLAADERMDVTLILIRRPFQAPTPDLTGPVERVRLLHVPAAPWGRPGMRARLVRGLVHYPFDTLPFHCYPRRAPALRRMLSEDRPDVVALYLPYLAHLAGHAPPGVPVVGVLEEGWERAVAASLEGPAWKKRWLARREAKRFARVYRRFDRRSSIAVAISDDERDRFAADISATKIRVISNGIDTTYFTPRESDERDVDVLVVGDLRSPRNYVGALKAWEASAGARWRWAFVGSISPELADRLRAGGATVTGAVDDLRPYYARARCVLVPALEGSGVKSTSIQAWAMRRPLVASPVGAQGLPAWPGRNILIGEDPRALVAHIRSLLDDPGMAERLAAAGRRTAERDCSLATLGREFAKLCLDAAAAQAGELGPASPTQLART